jgi:uncharacterized OB-fold protein
MTTSHPVPSLVVVDGDDVFLAASKCSACARTEFPGREACPACGAPMVDHRLGPEATLGAVTAVLHPPPGGLVEPPYVVGVAEFHGGVSVLGVVADEDLGQVRRGQRVRVATHETPSVQAYCFRTIA